MCVECLLRRDSLLPKDAGVRLPAESVSDSITNAILLNVTLLDTILLNIILLNVALLNVALLDAALLDAALLNAAMLARTLLHPTMLPPALMSVFCSIVTFTATVASIVILGHHLSWTEGDQR